MPDAYGFPNHSDVYTKLAMIAPDEIGDDLDNEIDLIITDVIATFEGPVANGPDDPGGTGRLWRPRAETRHYDGTGYAELRIDDILPPGIDTDGNPINPLTVACYDAILPSVGVKAPLQPGQGYHTLYFKGGEGIIGTCRYGFPRGTQNIAVTATYGNPVTPDVFEAIRCEAAYQLCVSGFVGLNGIGESVSIGDYSLNTSVGAINFKLTSPLTVYHTRFVNAITRYREKAERRWKSFGASRRMS